MGESPGAENTGSRKSPYEGSRTELRFSARTENVPNH